MLITQLKAKEAITSLTAGKKVFIINCHGCKEVRFPALILLMIGILEEQIY